MSGGKTSSSGHTQSQSTSTQALDPDIKNALLSNYAGLAGAVPAYTPYSGTTVADFTPAQLQSFGLVGNIASGNLGDATLNNGIAATQGVADFHPTTVTAPTAQAGLINPTSVSTVNAGLVGNMDLTPYLNPYQKDVIDTTTAAAQNALGQQINQNTSDATKLGAWRGNALSVQNGIDASQSNIGLANTVANLANTNFNTALGTATADLNRKLAADQGNQGTQLSEATTNANNTQGVNLANAAAALAAGQGNQQAGIAGAGLNLQAGQQLAAQGNQQLSQALQRATALNTTGNQQQAQQQALLQWAYQNNYLNPQQYAFALQQLKNQTLGLAGNPVLGSSQSTSSGDQKSNSWNFNSGISFSPLSLVPGG